MLLLSTINAIIIALTASTLQARVLVSIKELPDPSATLRLCKTVSMEHMAGRVAEDQSTKRFEATGGVVDRS